MESFNEESIDIIITNLKILGMLQVNEKLCIRKGHLQIDSDKLQFLKRWFHRDSRDIILIYLNDLIRNIFYLINSIKKYNDGVWIISRLLTELAHTENGLNNLKGTYLDDPYMIVKIDNYIIKFKEIIIFLK